MQYKYLSMSECTHLFQLYPFKNAVLLWLDHLHIHSFELLLAMKLQFIVTHYLLVCDSLMYCDALLRKSKCVLNLPLCRACNFSKILPTKPWGCSFFVYTNAGYAHFQNDKMCIFWKLVRPTAVFVNLKSSLKTPVTKSMESHSRTDTITCAEVQYGFCLAFI